MQFNRNNVVLTSKVKDITRGPTKGSKYVSIEMPQEQEGKPETLEARVKFMESTLIPWIGKDLVADILERYMDLQGQDVTDYATGEDGKIDEKKLKEAFETLSAKSGETIEDLEKRKEYLINVELDNLGPKMESTNPAERAEAVKGFIKVKAEIKAINAAIELRRRPKKAVPAVAENAVAVAK